MKTHDQGFDEKGKGKIKRKKENSNREKVFRYIASLNQEQISRMMENSANQFAQRHVDPTARAIMQNSINPKNMSVQAKLEISQPGDSSEMQADKVADAVSRGDISMSRMTMQQTGSEINAKGEGGTLTTTPEFNQQLESSKGSGTKLDEGTKSEMEHHMGADLSGVNIHTGTTASTMSENINAKAFTHGQDVYFKDGNYNPSSSEGKNLLAHELTHTVQQSSGKVQPKVQQQGIDTPPRKSITSSDELDNIERGAYNGDAAAQYAAAKNVLVTRYLALKPKEIELLNNIISKNGDYQVNPFDYVHEPEEKLLRDYVPRAQGTYDASDVETAAWNIVQNEASVKNAVLFFSQIKKEHPDTKDQDKELQEFYSLKGTYHPIVTIGACATTGKTDADYYDTPRKPMVLSDKNSFALDVSTYLHEMMHYIDIWYNSEAAIKYGKERTNEEDIDTKQSNEAEMKKGITPSTSDDLTEEEQISALSESLTATVDQIIIDMQQKYPQPNEHLRVPELRTKYYKWLNKEEASAEWKKLSGTQQQEKIDEHLAKVKKEQMKKPLKYYGFKLGQGKRWGLKMKKGQLSGTGMELGFAYEKAAYGFYDPKTKNKDWAVGFNKKFEEKYFKYLE